MGKKDRQENAYFDDPNRFADLFNGYFGRLLVDPSQLEDVDTVLAKSDDSADMQHIADCLKKQLKDGSLLALYLLENQSHVDYGMAARVMLEEGIAYDQQLRTIRKRNYDEWKACRQAHTTCELYRREKGCVHIPTDGEYLYRFRKDDRLRPVLPLVVYWGDGVWDGARSLHELLDKNAFAEYATSEQCSDLEPETRKLVGTLVGNQKLNRALASGNHKKQEEKVMWKAIEDLIEDGRQDGMEKGIETGIQNMVKVLRGFGHKDEEIKSALIGEWGLTAEDAMRYLDH